MKNVMIAAVFASLALMACESKNDKCKKVCDEVAAEEHKGDAEWLEGCKGLCDKATKE